MSSETKTESVTREAIGLALGRIPQGLFVLTAQSEDRRAGMLASWVQQASFDPPMISVAVAKGRPIMPLISDSHQFGLCQLAADEKVILRKFAGKTAGSEDPFLGFELVENTVLNLPILAGALCYLECQMTTHLDIEGDHDLFIARVAGAGCGKGEPHVHLRENGLKY
jgi:flavin reductase (DIM6/NTAB) family NADH-FMN oxidoreductase RutF